MNDVRRAGITALTILAWLAPLGAALGQDVQINVGDLPPGKTLTVTFQATVDSPVAAGVEQVSNQGTVAGNFTTVLTDDPDVGGGADPTVTDIVAAPDLTITKDDGGIIALPGDVVVYTLTYGNDGAGATQDAAAVTIVETVPTGSTFDGPGSTAGWSCSDGDPAGTVCTFAAGALAVGATGLTVDFAVEVDDPFPGGQTELDNTATIADVSAEDANLADNTANDTTTVVTDSDLLVEKFVDQVMPIVGENVVFTVKVTNNGPSPATGVEITDLLPSGLDFVTAVPSQGVYSDVTGIWDFQATQLAVGAMATLDITATVNPMAGDPAGTGAFIDAFVSAGSGGLDGPAGLLFGPDGNLYVASLATAAVLRYDGTSGAFVDAFVSAGSGGLDGPGGLVFGPDGNLYVTSSVTAEVLRYNGTSGAFIDAFVAAGSGGLAGPTGLVFGSDGNLYVASSATAEVLRYDGTSGVFIDAFVAAASGGLSAPAGLVFGPDGKLYVASSATAEVLRYDGTSGAFIDAFVAAASGGLGAPFGLLFGPDGNLYVASGATEEVLGYGGTSGAFLGALVSAGSGGLADPFGLLFGPDGNLYVSSNATDEVLRYDGFLTNFAEVTALVQTDPNLTNNQASQGVDYKSADFGDAPDVSGGPAAGNPYPTLLEHDGARHIVPPAGATLSLGAAGDEPDTEADGQPDATATGDDTDGNDDEDGVTFNTELVQGQAGSANVTVTGTGGLLNAWVDWNQNGVWTDTGEQIATDLPVIGGVNAVGITPPAAATLGTTFARFRIDSAGGLAATGRALDGEVEDHPTPAVLPPPVLSLAKDDGGITATPGSTIAYTLTYGNAAGTGTAVGVSLSDTVPANTTFDPGSSTAGWACVPDNTAGSVCTLAISDLAGGAGGGATFSVIVDSPLAAGVDQIDNTATLSASNATSAMDSDSTPVDAAPDLAITKDDGGVTTFPGGVVVYTLDVANNGDQDATGVVITDTVPAETTFDAPGSTAGWSCLDGDPAGTVCTFAVGALASGGMTSVDFAVEVNDPVTLGTAQIDNTTSVADDGTNGADPTPGDNSDNDTTPLEADLAVAKSVDEVMPIVGEQVVFTVTVTNDGPSVATGIEITDLLPSGLDYVTDVPSQGTYNDGSGVWMVGDLASAAMATLDVTATVNPVPVVPGGTITNIAEVTALDQTDPNLADNQASQVIDYQSADYGDAPDPLAATPGEYPTLLANDGARHIVPVAGATLFLGALIDTEADGQPTAAADGDDTTDLDDEDGVVFTSELVQGQAGSIDVTASAAGLLNAWIDWNQNGVWESPSEQIATDLAVAAGVNTVGFTTPAAATLGATFARFRIDTAGGLAPTGRALDGEVEDHQTPAVLLPPVLSLAKDDGGITVNAGDTIPYALVFGNGAGSGTAVGVTITDTVPANTTFDEAGSGGAGVWSCADGAPAGTVCTAVIADILGGGGGAVTFAVTVDSPLPAGVDQIDNTATIDAANAPAPAMASDSTPVDAAPDLQIVKDDGGVTSFPGGVIVYTLDFANVGSQGATGVEVTDAVPADTTFNEAASGGAGVWSCADGAPAGTVCTHVVGAVDGGGIGTGSVLFGVTVDDPVTPGVFEITNTAEIADDLANGPDENPLDNTDSDTTPLTLDFGDAPLPDYPTLFAADGARHVAVVGINLGSLIDAEIDGQPTPGADGDDLADLDDEDGVAFIDPLVAGTTVTVEVVASTAGFLNAWIDFNANGDWGDAGDQVFVDEPLAAGLNPLSVAVPAGAAPGQTFARFRFDTGGGLDFTGFASDGEVEDYAVDILAEADLAITKSDVFDPVIGGKTQVFRMFVTNNGPSKATGVQLVDTLPAGVFFLTAEPPAPQCLESGGVVTCDLPSLDPGETTDVRLVVLVGPETAGTITNSATVSSAATDPDPANDSATEDSEVLALRAMQPLDDFTGNGASEIATLESGSLSLRVWDAGTGAFISGTVFQPDFAPIALTSVPSFAGTTAPDLLVLARRTTDGLVGIFVRDALSGGLLRSHFLPADFRPFYLAAVPSFGGTSAWEVAVLGRRDADGLVRVTVLDAGSGAILRQYNQTVQFFPLGFEPVPDFSGNGVWELATVGRRAVNQALRVTMHDASTGLAVSQWNTDHTFQPTGFGVVTDVNGDGSADFSILGRRNPDGAVRVWTRDSATGVRLALFGFPLAWLPVDLGVGPDFAGPLFDEAAVLRYRPAPTDVRVTLKDSSNGAFLAGRLFNANFFPLDLEIVPSYAGGPADELAVWGVRLVDGVQRIFLIDPQSGADLGFVGVP